MNGSSESSRLTMNERVREARDLVSHSIRTIPPVYQGSCETSGGVTKWVCPPEYKISNFELHVPVATIVLLSLLKPCGVQALPGITNDVPESAS